MFFIAMMNDGEENCGGVSVSVHKREKEMEECLK